MSDDGDLERDVREEDELRALLRVSERASVPLFSDVAARARRRSVGRTAVPTLASAAALLLVLAGIALLRPGTTPATTATSSPTAAASPTSDASGCALPGSLDLQRHATGTSLIASIVSVRPTDAQTNQLWWTVRYLSSRDATGPATIGVRAQVTGSGRSFQQIVGYEQVEPAQRALSDGDVLTIDRCQAAAFVVRTAGLLDGTFPYQLTIEKVGLPEGGTISDTFEVNLACDARTFACDPVRAGASPTPTATPNPALVKPSFGIIYSGVRQGWDPGSAPLVRREGDADRAVGQLAPSYFNQFNGAVSPDGRKALYFAQGLGEPWALYLLDGAKPNEQQKLFEIPDEIPGGRPVWSGDGTGAVFTVLDAGANQGVTPKLSALRTIDLTTARVFEVARLTDSSTYTPIGWDRTTKEVAASISPHGAPARSYVVFSQTGRSPAGTPNTFMLERTTDLDGQYEMVSAPDAKQVAGLKCAATTGCALWTWPLADFSARTDQQVGASSMGLIGFRPGTSDLGLLFSPGNGALDRVELWSASAGRRMAYRFLDDRGLADAAFFRADGSALLLSLRLGAVTVVDLATGATTDLPQPSPQMPFEIGRPAASLRLG